MCGKSNQALHIFLPVFHNRLTPTHNNLSVRVCRGPTWCLHASHNQRKLDMWKASKGLRWLLKKSSDGAVISKTNRPKHTYITMRLPINPILHQELHTTNSKWFLKEYSTQQLSIIQRHIGRIWGQRLKKALGKTVMLSTWTANLIVFLLSTVMCD